MSVQRFTISTANCFDKSTKKSSFIVNPRFEWFDTSCHELKLRFMISRRRSASSMNWIAHQPYAPAGAIHGAANSWVQRTQFTRSRNSLLNLSFETNDRFNVGCKAKRYILNYLYNVNHDILINPLSCFSYSSVEINGSNDGFHDWIVASGGHLVFRWSVIMKMRFMIAKRN